MCGRYGLALTSEQLADVLEIDPATVPDIGPRYNIAPTQQAPVLGARDGELPSVQMLRWGLIPFWAKDKRIGARLLNARVETARDKPAFRDAFKQRRCLVPADGFYEWQKIAIEGSKRPRKQPWFIGPADDPAFVFAGLWERWRDPETAGRVFSFTILTTDANDLMRPIHDRMPVILPRDAWEAWLDGQAGLDHVAELARRPVDPHRMRRWPIGSLVNHFANDHPSIREPITLEDAPGPARDS